MKDQNNAEWNLARLQGELKDRLATADAPSKIWIACSGGLDSMLLAQLLWRIQKELKTFDLEILHVNYALRGQESDGDEALVGHIAQSMGCRLHVYKVDPLDHPPDGKGIQEWARDLRYGWFRELIGPADWVAFGHHADDLAENILMRLCRGHSLLGLSGMQRLHEKCWRPLLQLSRAELERIAEHLNLEWRNDSSNNKPNYTRNYLRLVLFPMLEKLFPGVKQNLLQHAEDVEDCLNFAQQQLAPLPSGKIFKLEDSGAACSPFLARQSILSFLQTTSPGLSVRREVLLDLYANLVSQQSKIMDLAPGLRVQCREGILTILSSSDKQDSRWLQYRAALLAEDPEDWPPQTKAPKPSE
ncbi:MAG: tRNA lysidine(34) synthetase TilS [Proteobacteria bacterium]|nr:tRNA lysidine(34) synthetase TilS [Pseudomonadota bacterium]